MLASRARSSWPALAELFRPSEHEPLAGEGWSEERAEQAIATIVADAEAAYDGERWPFHPADEIDDGPNAVYLGVAGMAWALHDLGSNTSWGDAVLVALERYRSEPDRGEEWAYAPSYLAGECRDRPCRLPADRPRGARRSRP